MMKYVQAVIALALFGWLGYSLLTSGLDLEAGGSSKTRLLKQTISSVVDTLGVDNTGYLCIAVGVALAAYFLLMRQE